MNDLERTLGPLRAGRNLVYFAEEVLGVKLNPAQKRWFYLLAQGEDGYSWVYRRVAHVAANQIGKTLGLAIALLWAAHNKIGTDNRNFDSWLSSPYKWYHLAPSQGQADFVRQDMILLIEGNHPAQIDPQTGERRPFRWIDGLATEVKYDKYYPGILLWNGSQIHFRTSEDTASAIHGVRANGTSVDEAAQEDNLDAILNKVLKQRVMSAGGPIWMVSTPDGINDWYEVVSDILNVHTHKPHPRIWEAPEERKALVWSVVQDNVGFGLSQEEVDFMEKDVTSETKEQSLRGAFLAPTNAFFVPQARISKAFRMIPASQEPRPGRRYVAFWDPSVGNDPTVLVVLDVSGSDWIGVYFQRWETPLGYDALMAEMQSVHAKWNGARGKSGSRSICTTGFDATSMGGLIIKQTLRRMSPRKPVNFAGHVKMDALTDLRASMFGRLQIPAAWLRLKREVLAYRLEDKNLVQDCVMALAGATFVAAKVGPGMTKERPFDPSNSTPAW